MLFLVSIAIALLFAVLCGKVLQKHPTPFYITAAVLALLFSIFPMKGAPDLISDYVIALFTKGSLSAAFFALVMFAGAFKAGSGPAKTLMPIRGELSIIASILIITHIADYGLKYLTRLFGGKLHGMQILLSIFAYAMTLLLIPLAVTSFKKIRKRMEAKKWKALQRFAYGFYALLYIHILFAYLPAAQHGNVKAIISAAVYSAVFIVYAAMRTAKALSRKKDADIRRITTAASTCGAAAFALIAALIVIPNTARLSVPAAAPASDPVSSTVSSSRIADTSSSSSGMTSSKVSSSRPEEATDSDTDTKSKIIAASDTDTKKKTATSKVTSSKADSKPAVNEIDESTDASQAAASAAEENEQSAVQEAPEEEIREESHTEQPSASPTGGEPDETPMLSLEELLEEETETYIYRDGEYTKECFEEDDDVRVKLTVTIKIESDKIVDVRAESDETDPWYLDNVIKEVIPRITEREGSDLGSLDDIDAYSGATLSSEGVIRCIREALEEARL